MCVRLIRSIHFELRWKAKIVCKCHDAGIFCLDMQLVQWRSNYSWFDRRSLKGWLHYFTHYKSCGVRLHMWKKGISRLLWLHVIWLVASSDVTQWLSCIKGNVGASFLKSTRQKKCQYRLFLVTEWHHLKVTHQKTKRRLMFQIV